MTILPEQISTMRDKAYEIVDFPAPVLPTTPILDPGSIYSVNPLRTSSVVGRYLNSTPSNSTAPSVGHFLTHSYPVFS